MDTPTVIVGQVVKPHGVKGELSVRSRSDNPERWRPGAVVRTTDGRSLEVTAVRQHGSLLLVSFNGVEDRSEAEALRGLELVVPADELPALGPYEWWPHELEGCAVSTESGRSLGTVASVIFNPANDLWVTVDPDGRETLVPALRELLIDVDISGKRIVVRDVPGLTAPDDTEPG